MLPVARKYPTAAGAKNKSRPSSHRQGNGLLRGWEKEPGGEEAGGNLGLGESGRDWVSRVKQAGSLPQRGQEKCAGDMSPQEGEEQDQNTLRRTEMGGLWPHSCGSRLRL